MNVPNRDKAVFKDMSDNEKLAIIKAKLDGTCQVFHGDWCEALTDDTLCLNSIYRTRQRKLEIPWKHIKKEYQWVVMNEDEGLWVYVVKPEIYNEEMWDIRGKCSPLPLNIDTVGIDWRESLTARPDGV